VPLSAAQYQIAFAQLCENIANYNRLAADCANRLHDYPENVAIPEQVKQVLYYDDLELGTALRNLSKNVSVWKKRLTDQRYPDADQKHAMYVALYQEAKSNADAERARQQSLANDARNNN
jgi:hypothetical protein